jgi:hypothetical protein
MAKRPWSAVTVSGDSNDSCDSGDSVSGSSESDSDSNSDNGMRVDERKEWDSSWAHICESVARLLVILLLGFSKIARKSVFDKLGRSFHQYR